jgi:hypothetical protein
MFILSYYSRLSFYWCKKGKLTYDEIREEIRDSREDVDWFQYFRDICVRWLINNPQLIGGPGEIVELDETYVFKRKNNVGRMPENRRVS